MVVTEKKKGMKGPKLCCLMLHQQRWTFNVDNTANLTTKTVGTVGLNNLHNLRIRVHEVQWVAKDTGLHPTDDL